MTKHDERVTYEIGSDPGTGLRALTIFGSSGRSIAKVRFVEDDRQQAVAVGTLLSIFANKFLESRDLQAEVKRLELRVAELELELLGRDSGSQKSGPDFRSQNSGPESWSEKYGRWGAMPCHGTPGVV